MPLHVGHSEMRCYGGGRGVAASINSKNCKIALVTVAMGAEMFAGVGRIEMAARRHACCWLAVRPSAGATVWIYVDMKTMVTRW